MTFSSKGAFKRLCKVADQGECLERARDLIGLAPTISVNQLV